MIDNQSILIKGVVQLNSASKELIESMLLQDIRTYISNYLELSGRSDILFEGVDIPDITNAVTIDRYYDYDMVIEVCDIIIEKYNAVAVKSVVVLDEMNIIVNLEEPRRW